jgi:uncharacterized protein YecT (DUF1311 family)
MKLKFKTTKPFAFSFLYSGPTLNGVLLTITLAVSSLLLLNPGMLYSQAESSHKCAEGNSDCIKKAYEKVDKKLNTVYQTLRKKLSAESQKKLKEESVKWIGLKEFNCGWQKDMATEPEKDFVYYGCLYDYTSERIVYLDKAYAGKGSTGIVSGTYEDSNGGTLTVKEKTKGLLEFYISVVRGPTSHIGEIEGNVTILNKKGTFKHVSSESTDAAEDMEKCKLDFSITSFKTTAGERPEIEVTEDGGCQYFHGARAYFDGVYHKVSDSSEHKSD